MQNLDKGAQLGSRPIDGKITDDAIGCLVDCGRGHTQGLLPKEAVTYPKQLFRNTAEGPMDG